VSICILKKACSIQTSLLWFDLAYFSETYSGDCFVLQGVGVEDGGCVVFGFVEGVY